MDEAVVTQVTTEIVGSRNVAEVSQVIVEIVSGFGNIRVSHVYVEVVVATPALRPIVITGRRGRDSSLRFGQNGYVVSGETQAARLSPLTIVRPEDISFRSPQVRLAARFSGAQIADILDGRPSFIAPWNSVRITSDDTDQITNVLTGEEGRLDIISLAMYGTEDYWWVIAQANDITNVFTEPYAGDRIRIPSISRVLRILGQSSPGNELSRFKP